MRRSVLLIFLFLAMASQAQADCITLSTAGWTQDQRRAIISGAMTLIPEITLVNWQPLPSTDVKLCSPTTDVSGLTAEALQAAAQIAHETHTAKRAEKETETEDIKAKLQQSQFCQTATFAQIATRVAAQKEAVQTDIDAIDATGTVADVKQAMTTLNNRTWAVFQALAECTIGPRRLP